MADLLSMWKDYSPSPNQPNIANSYLNAYQAGQNIRGKELEQQAFLEEQQRQRNLQQQIQNSGQKAAGGDLASLTQYALVNPQGVPALINALQYRQETQGQMANHVINLPLSQRPEAYKMYLQSLAEQGTDISQMPRDYSDKVYNGLLATRNNSRKINDVLDDQKRQFQEQLLQAQIQSQQVGQQLDQARMDSEGARQRKYNAEINKLNREAANIKLSAIDQTQLKESREKANTASELLGDVQRMKQLIPQVQFSPFVGEGKINNAKNLFYGSGRQADEFKRLTTRVSAMQLKEYPGSISDFEQKLSRSTSANLGNTPEGAAALALSSEVTLSRAIERASFEEAYAARHGNLNGSSARWNKFIKENPVLYEDVKFLHDGTKQRKLLANEENISNWQQYLD